MAKAKKKVQPRRKPAAQSKKSSPSKPQKFAFSHLREEDFDQGLRPYSAYRDLGFAGDRRQGAGACHPHDQAVQRR